MADDIGEALNFVVGFAKIGVRSSTVSSRLRLLSRNCASAASRARVERCTRKMEMPASKIDETGAANVTMEASCSVRSAVWVRSETAALLPVASDRQFHRCARPTGRSRTCAASRCHRRYRAGWQSRWLFRIHQSRRTGSLSIGVIDLSGIVAGQSDQFIDIGMNAGSGGEYSSRKRCSSVSR